MLFSLHLHKKSRMLRPDHGNNINPSNQRKVSSTHDDVCTLWRLARRSQPQPPLQNKCCATNCRPVTVRLLSWKRTLSVLRVRTSCRCLSRRTWTTGRRSRTALTSGTTSRASPRTFNRSRTGSCRVASQEQFHSQLKSRTGQTCLHLLHSLCRTQTNGWCVGLC
jgi:hypothetical protein